MIGLATLLLAAHIAPPCTAAQLSGTFKVVPNSAGAWNIVYALRVKNSSSHTCFVSGTPEATLLDKRGRKLPTHTRPAQPGMGTAVLVTLAPGKTAKATARFSPDVPGTGEQTIGQCEPKSYWLRVTPNGGGTFRAPIEPPTPVCEHGGMSLSLFTHG
jgi:hypothetical protein